MSYLHYGYGFEFKSNVEIFGLRSGSTMSLVDLIPIELNFFYKSYDLPSKREHSLYRSTEKCHDELYLRPKKITDANRSIYTVNFFGKITYVIERNAVAVYTRDMNMFISTFFNIPMSVLLILNKRILLHCSAFMRGSNLFPLSADKGHGKSTLTAYAVTQGDKLFCDDTLPVLLKNGELYVAPATTHIKLNLDSCKQLGIENHMGYKKNITGKIFIEKDFSISLTPLRSLYFVSRRGNNTSLISIGSKIMSRTLILGSVVGISWLDTVLRHKVVFSQIYDALCNDVALHKFSMEFGWDKLQANYAQLLAHQES